MCVCSKHEAVLVVLDAVRVRCTVLLSLGACTEGRTCFFDCAGGFLFCDLVAGILDECAWVLNTYR